MALVTKKQLEVLLAAADEAVATARRLRDEIQRRLKARRAARLMLLRTSHLLCAATIATCVFAAACGDDTPTSPSGAVLQSLTVVGPSGAGAVILRRNETAT